MPLKIAAAITVALIWFAPTAIAQTSSDSGAEATPALATLLHGGVMGELLSINVPRAQDEIRQLLDDAHRLEKSAANEIETCRRLKTEAEGRTNIMRQEIETTKARREAAKKTKDPLADEYEASYKKQTRELKYLTQLVGSLEADADRLEAAKAAASSTARALDLELDVVRMQAEIGDTAPTAETVDRYRKLLQDMLEAQRGAAAKARIAADKKAALADQRLKQLAALSKLSD